MVFETMSHDGCRTHLIASERTREAVLVDPLLTRADELLAALRGRGLMLRWVVDTHTHADHLSAGAALLSRSDAGYLMHKDSPCGRVSRRVSDGESLGLGELTLRFVHVPGHTRDSLMIALPGRLLSGDFLLMGQDGAGRLDLPGADVDAHYESLRRLDAFSDETVLAPAHDYRGRAASTLQAERAANPVLKPRSREEYLRWWTERRGETEGWMREMIAANAAGVVDPAAAPAAPCGHSCAAGGARPSETAVEEWTPAELSRRLTGGGLALIDVRQPEEFTGELGRVPGSRLIPLGELTARLAEVPDSRIVTICRSGKRSAKAAAELLRAGRTEVRSLAGGMLAWNEAGLPVERGS